MIFLWFSCWHLEVGEQLTGAGSRSQRGLEFPSAEVGRWSLKDEGDRQGDKHGPLSIWGPLGVTLFRSLSVVCLGRSLAFSRFFSGALRGKLCWFKIGLWLLGLGSDLFFLKSHLSFYFLRSGTQMSDAGTRVRRAVMCRRCNPSFICLFAFEESHLKLKLELRRGWMRLHIIISCSPLVTTLTQIDSIYSDSCAQLAVAPLYSTGGICFGLAFGKMIHPVTLKSG